MCRHTHTHTHKHAVLLSDCLSLSCGEQDGESISTKFNWFHFQQESAATAVTASLETCPHLGLYLCVCVCVCVCVRACVCVCAGQGFMWTCVIMQPIS